MIIPTQISPGELPNLKVDSSFQRLIRPSKKNYLVRLEKSIAGEGCRNPIITWNGIIVDGHKRYEICKRRGILFTTDEMEFDSREVAIAHICRQQLERKDLTEEYRKYLIGTLYDTEKTFYIPLSKPKTTDSAADSSEQSENSQPQTPGEKSKHITAQRIASQYHVSFGTVQKYAAYSRAINTLWDKVPELPPRILASKYKVSHKSILELAELTPWQIQKVASNVELNEQPFVQYSKMRAGLQEQTESGAPGNQNNAGLPSIKDMPAYDPDAEITGLTLTIPSWISSIERVRDKADFTRASTSAKEHLISALMDLQLRVVLLVSKTREG